MASDTPLFGTCEMCMFGSLLAALFGSLVLFAGFGIDIADEEGGVLKVFGIMLVCYLVGVYIVLTTWLYGYITNKIINFIFGEPDIPDTINRCSVITSIIILPILFTGSMWLALNDVFNEIVHPNNPFYTFLKIFIPHFIGCIILILIYGVILCGIYIKIMRTKRCNSNSQVLDVV